MKRRGKISLPVSVIVNILHDPVRVLRRSYHRGFSEGLRVHEELGYTNRRVFTKVVGEFVVSGIPDRIVDDRVEDLKTYYSEDSRLWYERLAHTQCNLYCFLTGLPRYRIVFYNMELNKITHKIDVAADFDQALRDIKKAGRIWKKLHKVLGLL